MKPSIIFNLVLFILFVFFNQAIARPLTDKEREREIATLEEDLAFTHSERNRLERLLSSEPEAVVEIRPDSWRAYSRLDLIRRVHINRKYGRIGLYDPGLPLSLLSRIDLYKNLPAREIVERWEEEQQKHLPDLQKKFTERIRILEEMLADLRKSPVRPDSPGDQHPLAGVWTTGQWGKMILRFDSDGPGYVTGCYDHDYGQLQGNFSGGKEGLLKGTWREKSEKESDYDEGGEFEFRFKGDSYDGKWRYSFDKKGRWREDWDGKRVIDAKGKFCDFDPLIKK